ncbi:uncharacterized protein LOC110981705 isoform X2 [Acanthaster planci]|uniref:Uncharacterized protein LOC110981705 isoform X2 n=1 Tax=Acanthaster planci TaxID=133434 RepID=A0A8B7YR92_ACAPL|nr:uncharacterized protein LOC110981705 isoform X2 [Acanthaster planci]
MADGDGNPHEIFWTREERSYNKDSDGYLHSFVPGVDQPGNIKMTQKMKFHQSNDMLNKAMKASGDERLMKERTNTESRVENHDRRKDKDIHKSKTSSVEAPRLKDKPSLKDLKPEDKKRIANLIRELAKAGEEKEVIVQQLSVERRSYEDKVNKLHEQMAAIIQERELTQKQYLECQKLLAEYQSQLASEQEKLALSLHHRASPPKFGMAPQSPTKPAPDYAPVVKKNQSNTPHKERQLRTLRVTDHQTTSQHATLTQSNGYNNAPHTGYRYPVTHQSSLVQDYQVPDIHQTSSWNQPAGTHQHPVPRTQLSHPNIIGTEFNPLLASTHRSQQVHSGNTSWTEPQVRVLASRSEPAMYVSYGTNRNPQGYMFQPGLDPEHRIHLPQSGPSSSYPKDSQEMFGSRPQSGEFRPLQPELETDFESQDSKSPQYVAAFWNHQNGAPDGLQGNTQRDKIGSNNHHHGEISEIPHAVTRQPAYQATGLPEQCHAVLERQRHELRQEQALLRQKLKDQEKILLQKQNQLELHRLRQLEQEGQRHSTSSHMEREWLDHGSGTVATSHPQKNVKDLEWEEPNIYSGMQHEVPSGSENDSDEVISTNYPPESFMNQSTSKEALETSMRRLHVSPRSRNPCGTDMSNARVAIATENPSQRTRGIKIDGYASLYPNSQPRNKIHVQGSMPSYSPSTSSSGMSQARMVDRSTSPLYKDHKTETARSPGKGGLSLSPGKVHITPAPAAHTNREPIQMQHRRSNATRLSDLISEMESPTQPNTTHARLVNITDSRSMIRQRYISTPDLFQDVVDTDTDTELQESRILEDVFFL